MKKIFLMIFCIIYFTSVICEADTIIAPENGKLSPERISLGGISIFSNSQYVRKIYGNPKRTKVDYPHSIYYYGKDESFIVYFTNDEEFFKNSTNKQLVTNIETNANNGISTPDGICVGMDEAIIIETYGKPEQLQEPNKRTNWNKVYYYWGNVKLGAGARCLSFACNNGRITSIACWYYI